MNISFIALVADFYLFYDYFHKVYSYTAYFIFLYIITLTMLLNISYVDFNSSLNLSAIIAINSLLVGFPLEAETVYPNILSTVSV